MSSLSLCLRLKGITMINNIFEINVSSLPFRNDRLLLVFDF